MFLEKVPKGIGIAELQIYRNLVQSFIRRRNLRLGFLHHKRGNNLTRGFSGNFFEDGRKMSGSNKLFFSIKGNLAFVQITVAYIFQELKHNLLFSRDFIFGEPRRLRNHVAKLVNGGREQVPDDFIAVGGSIIAFQNRLQEVCIFPDSFEGFWIQAGMPHQLVPEVDKGIQPVDLQRQFLRILPGKSNHTEGR